MVARRGLRRRAVALAGLLGLLLVLPGSPAGAQGLVESFRRGVQAQAAFVRGKAHYDALDYRSARDRFTEAVTHDPAHDEALALLAWSQYYLGEYRAAAITFKTALRRQPKWEGLHDGLGWSRLRLGRYHLAGEAFQAALDLHGDYVDALIGLGTAQFELGRYDTALPPLEKAIQRSITVFGAESPDVPGIRAKVAWSLYYLGRYREALRVFERAARTAPDGHGLHNGIGWCLLKLGDKERARAAFQRALSLRPGYEDALEGLRQTSG